ncbi:MAG: 4a-hydroxytetrahydrobiopterin dehydratase [Candidatus Obscuribacterales bacterium]|nr:4a-hydroxytetrahydrobiopterin dehydratase [Candidatus Obscuribacterales bacterium]
MALAEKKCEACISATRALKRSEFEALFSELKNWNIENDHHLSKSFKTANFKEALELANQIGALAEQEGHHPDLHLAWGLLKIEMWTHKVDGLTEADFVLAAKIDLIRA